MHRPPNRLPGAGREPSAARANSCARTHFCHVGAERFPAVEALKTKRHQPKTPSLAVGLPSRYGADLVGDESAKPRIGHAKSRPVLSCYAEMPPSAFRLAASGGRMTAW